MAQLDLRRDIHAPNAPYASVYHVGGRRQDQLVGAFYDSGRSISRPAGLSQTGLIERGTTRCHWGIVRVLRLVPFWYIGRGIVHQVCIFILPQRRMPHVTR